MVWSAAARNIATMTPGKTLRNASLDDGMRAVADASRRGSSDMNWSLVANATWYATCAALLRCDGAGHRRVVYNRCSMSDDVNRDLAQKYDTVAYAAQANAQSHPRHLATVATLLGLSPRSVESARVLEVGCSDGANLLPMAASLPGARFTGCDISGQAIAAARRSAGELGIGNVEFVQADLATLGNGGEPFDYIIAHGVYSWVPATVRDALLALARDRLHRDGVMFVSFNVYPGCHVRQAAWEMLRHHVAHIPDPRARLDQARALAGLIAEPSVAQTEVDGLLRHEFAKLATQSDSALFHDDLGVPNDPVYFHEFVAHLARYDLTYLGETKLSMMTAAGLTPRVQQFLSPMDRLTREQYLDFARLRRFRQSLVCRADASPSALAAHERAATMHAAASMSLVRAAAEGKAFADAAAPDASGRATRRLLQWLVQEAPRVIGVQEAARWLAQHAPEDASAARPVPALLAEASYAGTVDLYIEPPPLAAAVSERPVASAIVRWQAARQPGLTNLRHEPLRIDDPHARELLVLLDGTRTRDDVTRALALRLPDAERAQAHERMATYLSNFALHGLLAG
jgi:2-polyprenyl-3-methyl-5-hydroxy-6-metoxy-1,4-benzoquinol methylase